jgi:hypothetical protein
MGLLTTYIHHSELQAIAVPPLISTIHKSPQHPLSLCPACCVFTSRSLETGSNSRNSSTSRLKSFLHSLPSTTQLNQLCPLFITSLHGSHKTPFFCCCGRVRCRGNMFTILLPRNGRGADHRKHQWPLFTEAPLSNGSILQLCLEFTNVGNQPDIELQVVFTDVALCEKIPRRALMRVNFSAPSTGGFPFFVFYPRTETKRMSEK